MNIFDIFLSGAMLVLVLRNRMHSPESLSAGNPTLMVVNREQSHGFINVLGHMMVCGPM